MERLGLNKKNFFNIGLDNCLKRTKYNKVNIIKFENDVLSRNKVENNVLKLKELKKKEKDQSVKSLNQNDNLRKEKKIKKIQDSERINEAKKNNKKKGKKKVIIFLIIIIIFIFLIFEIFTTLIEPSLIAMCEIRANSIGVTVSSKAVKQVMEEVGYDNQLVNLEKDNEGNIIALKANVVQMNYIASLIGSRTQQMYNELTETYVQIPIGNFTGNALLAGRGPRIRVKIMPVGTVGSDFKTEFVSTGINQTRHRVYLQVVSSMRVIAPFSTKTIKVVNNVNVAETVLIGNVPNSYYNLEGLDNIADDSLNLWDE